MKDNKITLSELSEETVYVWQCPFCSQYCDISEEPTVGFPVECEGGGEDFFITE